ncbi:VWA domain-containing protein [Thermomonospora umbrina]|uniref:Ca-activated chloride channel family protein n=1 Tax=Thermomonospora umbrina TaxID=111806 RepID=A0A3D9SG65_9ACTN|nr:VWA domain-containing protein [Thermomonospora umbrina]REE94908.1 Ca-activated chloride channel family protein [Thermomonospora umbrina]
MTFLDPIRLLLLIAPAGLLAAYAVMWLRRGRYAVRFTNLELLEKVAPLRPGWRRHAPAAAFLLMTGLFVTGFARPAADVRVPREQATIMIAVDVSTSMEATDVAPDRLTAAKRAARSLLGALPERFNVGLVSFSGTAAVAVPPTTDRRAVQAGVDGLGLGPRTAIGEAVFTSLEAVAAFGAQWGQAAPPARIVLLSDGSNTTGRTPEVAAQRAVQARVPVSTIAYGTPEGVIESEGAVVPVPVDGPALERLAQATGGRFYEAATGAELSRVYADIGSSIGYRTERREIWAWFVGGGLVLAFAAAAGSLLWFSRLP